MVNHSRFQDADQELWVLLHQTRHLMNRAREAELTEFGISAMQSAVLSIVHMIDHASPVTPAEISRRLLRRAHGVSTLLDRMEKEGFVRRVKDLERRNMVRVEITEKGERAYAEASRRRVVHEIMSVLTDEERQAMSSGLHKIRGKALEELKAESRPPYFPPEEYED
jgi:MarR family transcriptional regulator, organic hydroperoxide resistance regulator